MSHEPEQADDETPDEMPLDEAYAEIEMALTHASDACRVVGDQLSQDFIDWTDGEDYESELLFALDEPDIATRTMLLASFADETIDCGLQPTSKGALAALRIALTHGFEEAITFARNLNRNEQ